MFFHILKKDLKRKKTVNIILILFIILSAMFVASGLNNVLTVFNGTDYYFDKADIGDYVIITMGADVVGNIEEALKDEASVEDLRIENTIFGSNNVYYEDGKEVETRNATLYQSIDRTRLHLFDKNDNEITEIPEGHIYAAGLFLANNDISEGDTIKVKLGKVEKNFIVDGRAKDAFLGSSFMGNTRFLINEKDYQDFLADEDVKNYYQGELAYIDSSDLEALSAAISKIPGLSFDGSRSILKMCYVMDLMVAFITLILSVCLMLVSFMVLKFSINLTITEEFREIGVMKAIGLKNRAIRSLYVFKFLALSVVGGIIGFFVSIPFGNMLIESAADNMILGNDMGYLVNLIGAVVVIILIPLYAYHCTRRVKKSSPIDAIRSGQTGERYKSKKGFRVGKSRLSTNLYMACNDFISSPKKYITIMISFFICTLLILLIVNSVSTMKSDSLIYNFATKSDLYMDNTKDAMSSMGGTKEEFENHFKDMEKELADHGMPANLSAGVLYKYQIMFNGNSYNITCQQGVNQKITDYEYKDDTVIPTNKNEILITESISEMTGAKIGDTMTIDFGSEKLDCTVTGYFQTMQQLGKLIRLHQDAPTEFDHVSSIMQYQIDFKDNPSVDVIEERKEDLKDFYDNEKVMNTAEYCADCVGVVDTLEAVELLLLAITLVVVLLVTILIERSFIADEKTQIAVLKAIGFKHKDVISWHTCRFGIATLIAVILAAIASIPMTKLCITPVFGMMGANSISFKIDFLQVFLIFPGIVFLATILSTFIVAQYSRSITCRDTASIE